MRTKIIPTMLATAMLAFVNPSEAQQQAKVPRAGLLVNGSSSNFATRIEAFQQGLRDLGYVEGRNIVIEYRYSEGKMDRLPDLAAELVHLKVNLIVTHAVLATQAVKKLTTTIPIVIANVGDAVATGLVPSLARPGGNITGLTNLSPELTSKGLELLRETFSSVTHVAFLSNPANPMHGAVMKEIEAAAGVLRVELQLVEVRDPCQQFFRSRSTWKLAASCLMESISLTCGVGPRPM